MKLKLTALALLLLAATALPPAASAEVQTTFTASGDLALKSNNADLVVSGFALGLQSDYTLTLGDNTNDSSRLLCNESPCTTVDDYEAYFAPTWGRLLNLRPSPGNHDYLDGGGGYLQYFDVPRYYAFDVPGWRIYSLNSQLKLDQWKTEQTWFRNDLAGVPSSVGVLAYFHYPRYSVSCHHSGYEKVQKLWDILAAHEAPARLVLNGNNHIYERYAPIQGIVEIEISTGGAKPAAVCSGSPSPVVSDAGYHVAQLTLTDTADWSIVAYDVNPTTGTGVVVDEN